LRLDLERGWEDLGAVDVAMFRVGKIDFALRSRCRTELDRRVLAAQA
jgi:hypothetical protein